MSPQLRKPFIVWIYPGDLDRALDSSTWLKTVYELRNSGWRVILISVGASGWRQIHGVDVLCFSRPEIYLLRHAIYHLKVIKVILKQFTNLDLILFHEISAPWILPLRFWRGLRGRRRPLFVMDTRSLPMSRPGKETWKEKIRKGAYRTRNPNEQSLLRWSFSYYAANGRSGSYSHGKIMGHLAFRCRNREFFQGGLK